MRKIKFIVLTVGALLAFVSTVDVVNAGTQGSGCSPCPTGGPICCVSDGIYFYGYFDDER
ncbi:hypothetical protein [Aureibacter tunicatorum]|uniref:Uncharacterized protein n=1 Tax=Aureibacter tunicatorum TaxID=866807 RepID=A0AAE4BU25_9BACT|nr:hypothetical protein [Aureibacter tunicatorum]MDR6241346.1 hypothetical protein [Aureibacter tunicatorum]BDD03605.1 hypothetical protein AUTU_10880 [Aureibacter tunicatorum]